MTWVAGADGLRGGWRVVLFEIDSGTSLMRDVGTFSERLELHEGASDRLR
jgi:hypothetical protein